MFILGLLMALACQSIDRILSEPSQSITKKTLSYASPKGAQVAFIKNTRSFLAFSGEISSGSFKPGLSSYYFNPITYEFNLTESSSASSPSPRKNYGIALISQTWLYLFGGLTAKGAALNDFWRYDVIKDSWEQLTNLSISARYNFAYTTFYNVTSRSHKFAIVSGIGTFGNLSDFYIIEIFLDQTFIVNKMPSLSPAISSSLIGAQLQYLNSKLYLFSGYIISKNSYNQDLFVYSFDDNTWNKSDLYTPLIRSLNGGSFVRNNSLFYYFGQNDQGLIPFIYRLDLFDLHAGWTELIIDEKFPSCKRSSFAFSTLIKEQGYNDYVVFFFGSSEAEYLNSRGLITINNDNSIGELICTGDEINPRKRIVSTISQISDSLILFGGMSSNKVLNDLWMLNSTKDPTLSNWTLIQANGQYPSARYIHSSASQGSFMIIGGGLDVFNNFLSDYWLLDASNQIYQWKKIVPDENSIIPPPLIFSCIVVDIPYFYIVGGQKNTYEITGDVWRYDLSNNTFKKAGIKGKIQGISQHGCFLEKVGESLFIYTIFGIVQNPGTPRQDIVKFDITDFENVIFEKVILNVKVPGRGNFGYTVINSTIFLVGGLESKMIKVNNQIIQSSVAYNDLWKIDLRKKTATRLNQIKNGVNQSYELDSKLFYMGSASVSGKFLIYSGADLATTYDTSYVINLNSYLNEEKDFCGPASEYNGSYCNPCKTGHYKSDSDTDCKSCKDGTYLNFTGGTHVSQCLPCPLGYFSNTTSQSGCTKCDESTTCFSGSTNNSINYEETLILDSHIISIRPDDNQTISISIGSIILFLILIFSIFWAISLKFRAFFSAYDLFIRYHIDPPKILNDKNEVIEEIVIVKYPLSGGFFSGLSIILLCSILIYYINEAINERNIETTSSVISNSITDDADYPGLLIYIYLQLFSLRNYECKNPPQFSPSSSDMQLASGEINYNLSSNPCQFKFTLNKTKIVESNDYVEFFFDCDECYTSDIRIAVESDAAYHNKISRRISELILTNGTVFKGKLPSIFSFELSPTLYYDTTSKDTIKEFGYRVSHMFAPLPGTTTDLTYLYLNKGIKIRVEFTMSLNGVYTTHTPKRNGLGFIFLVIASLNGIVGASILLMRIFEVFYYRVKYKRENVQSKYHDALSYLKGYDSNNKDDEAHLNPIKTSYGAGGISPRENANGGIVNNSISKGGSISAEIPIQSNDSEKSHLDLENSQSSLEGSKKSHSNPQDSKKSHPSPEKYQSNQESSEKSHSNLEDSGRFHSSPENSENPQSNREGSENLHSPEGSGSSYSSPEDS